MFSAIECFWQAQKQFAYPNIYPDSIYRKQQQKHNTH